MKAKKSGPERIIIFDTTLRDGEQSPGATMNAEEKVRVAQQLARLNVDVIEAGFPVSSPGDFEAVEAIAKNVEGPVICGLARTDRDDIDRAWMAVQHAAKARIHTFVATSEVHMKKKLNKTPKQVMGMAVSGVKYAKQFTDDVEFSPEDAVRSKFDFLCEVVEKAIDAGATTVNIPDTVGYSTPAEFGELIRRLIKNVPNSKKAIISVHCHNDLGLATANSIAAIVNGARQVECTINGLGERAGNASMEEIVMALYTRRDLMPFTTGIVTQQIYKTSRLVSNITGIDVQPNKAVVGRNAFAHEAGIHQDGIIKERRTYEIMDAETVGVPKSTLVIGKHSGRHAFLEKLRELGYELSEKDMNRAFFRFKDIADRKKEISDLDIQSIIEDEIIRVPDLYRIQSVNVMCGGRVKATAMIELMKDDRLIEESAIGVGPVDAVYQCIKKITKVPNKLVDFSVKSVTGGIDAIGEVTVKVEDKNGKVYTGRGASLDIVESSARAYINAINKLIHWQQQHGKGGGGVRKTKKAKKGK
ncbi:MAG: 2-isopropylmalate synthase [bacterium]